MLQLERKLDASQETIVDQQQTIEKFRELVHQMQGGMAELRQRGAVGGEGGGGSHQAQAVVNLNAQLKSTTIKQTSRVGVGVGDGGWMCVCRVGGGRVCGGWGVWGGCGGWGRMCVRRMCVWGVGGECVCVGCVCGGWEGVWGVGCECRVGGWVGGRGWMCVCVCVR